MKSISYTVGSEVLVIKTNDDLPEDQKVLKAGSTMDLTFRWRFDKARVYTATATVVLTMNGEDFTFTRTCPWMCWTPTHWCTSASTLLIIMSMCPATTRTPWATSPTWPPVTASRTVQLNTSEDLIAACGNEEVQGHRPDCNSFPPSGRCPDQSQDLLRSRAGSHYGLQ